MPKLKNKIEKSKKKNKEKVKIENKLKTKKARTQDLKKSILKPQKTTQKAVQKTVKLLAKKPSREPQTMAELLAQTGYQIRGLRRGQEVEGIVTQIGKNMLSIDIGAKTDGIVLGRELEACRELVSSLKVGDKLKVVIGLPENEKGQILLSLKKANEDYKWNLLEKYYKEGTEVEVRGLDVNKGGMIARLMNIYGFIPASQFGRQHLGNLNSLYNKTFKVKIIELDRAKNRLIFSEKAVSEAEALAAQKEAAKLVKVNDVLEGVVSGIMPFGIFVRVDVKEKDQNLFLEGLVHISEISWEKVKNPNKLFKVGDKIKVKVLEIDKATNRLNLSIKQLTPDPWLALAEKYQPEKKFLGKVSKLAAFGAFVSLDEKVEGLIHISKIPADYQIKVGDKVEVYIEKVDVEHHRLSLGLVLSKKPVGYK